MRALIVDDSSFVREFMRQQLTALDIESVDVEDGSLALTLLRRGERFDLMLVDVNMPIMDGLKCVEAVRHEHLGHDMKIMMVTTASDHEQIEHAFACGADEFLMKPFTQQSLREKLLLMNVGEVA